MDGTERRVLVVGTIACLLALSAAAGAASSAAVAAAPPDSSPLPASPEAFAELATGARGERPAPHGQASFRNAVELMILVATCGIVVAFYSALSGGQGRKRVLMRIRRR